MGRRRKSLEETWREMHAGDPPCTIPAYDRECLEMEFLVEGLLPGTKERRLRDAHQKTEALMVQLIMRRSRSERLRAFFRSLLSGKR